MCRAIEDYNLIWGTRLQSIHHHYEILDLEKRNDTSDFRFRSVLVSNLDLTISI